MDIRALPYVSLLGFIWGTTLLADRFSLGQFSSTTYISLRLFLTSLGFLAIYLLRFRGRKWPTDRRLWRQAALLGIFGSAIPMNLVVLSLKYQSSGLTSILLTTGPALTVLIAHFLLPDESLTARKTLGVSLAFGGAFLLAALGESGLPDISRANPIGYLLVFTANVCESWATIYARKYMRSQDAFEVASIRTFAAALVMLPVPLLLAGYDLSRVDSNGLLALGYATVFGTFFGMLLQFYNIKRFGATPAAMTNYIIPVVASLGGVLLLGEQLTPGILGGMFLIILGIALLNYRSGRNQPPKNV